MKIHDLSMKLSVDDMVFPGTPKMSYTRTHTVQKDFYNLGLASINTHAGTHTDAPLHFIDNGTPLGMVDVHKYVGYAVVADCASKGSAFDTIDIEDLSPYSDKIEKYKKVIIKTGWSKFANQDKYYTDYPVISLELAKWLVQKGIDMVGVEPPSLNPPLYIEVHKTFLENSIAIVEGLTNLQNLPEVIFFSGAPVALKEADGFPIRAIGIEF